MADQKLSQGELFRSSLTDLITITQKLIPHCDSLEDMRGMVELALTNDGQLKLLMNLIVSKK